MPGNNKRQQERKFIAQKMCPGPQVFDGNILAQHSLSSISNIIAIEVCHQQPAKKSSESKCSENILSANKIFSSII